tara:strand:- start:2062 stop:2175 length:114 start_codon:yes stop_codon:yes gene_type:complete
MSESFLLIEVEKQLERIADSLSAMDQKLSFLTNLGKK